VAENKVEFVCDDSIAKEGDACDTNGEEACAMDKKAILVCSANKFGKPRPCPGPKGCTYDEAGDRYACDDGSESSADAGAEAGAPLSPRAPPAPNAGSKAKH
jgi:hypothetical protein